MKHMKAILVSCALIGAVGATAAPSGKQGVSFSKQGKGYSFEYSYPTVVNGFPALKSKFESERIAALAEIKAQAQEMLADLKGGDMGPTFDQSTHWQQVTNLPNYLSLSADIYQYQGGAHGGSDKSSLIWDKKAAKSIVPIEMFTSKKAFNAVVQTPFCDKLDKERSKRRGGEKVDRRQKDDWTQACPDPADFAVLLGSSNGKAFNRMAIYVGQYGAGPYAEGDYEIDLPVTKAVLEIVKPAYRDAFAVK